MRAKKPSESPAMFTTLLLTATLAACSASSPIASTFPDRPTFKARHAEATLVPDAHLALACCDLLGECVWVDYFAECPFPYDVYYCEWGISNVDGTVECFD